MHQISVEIILFIYLLTGKREIPFLYTEREFSSYCIHTALLWPTVLNEIPYYTHLSIYTLSLFYSNVVSTLTFGIYNIYSVLYSYSLRDMYTK